METQKCEIFSKSLKFEFDEIEICPYPEFPYGKKWNHLRFVNTSPT